MCMDSLASPAQKIGNSLTTSSSVPFYSLIRALTYVCRPPSHFFNTQPSLSYQPFRNLVLRACASSAMGTLLTHAMLLSRFNFPISSSLTRKRSTTSLGPMQLKSWMTCSAKRCSLRSCGAQDGGDLLPTTFTLCQLRKFKNIFNETFAFFTS